MRNDIDATRNEIMSTESRASRGGVSLALAAAAALVAAGTGVGSAVGQDGPDVEGARTALEQWVQTRRVISQERRDWTLGREMLDDRIALVEREIASLRERIGEAQDSIADADRKRAELIESNERLQQASSSLAETAAQLEDRTKQLLARLPDPIRERVKPLSQRLPADPEDTQLSLSQRFQNVVGILNEVNKFNREISVTSEVRSLADGTTAEVAALYVGLGQAYYATSDGRAAGVGAPSAEGWAWSPADASAAEITRAIAILKNEDVAAFVRLPIRMP
jgi:predicted RNase H-like nuclease (RuvC/YqgF family)